MLNKVKSEPKISTDVQIFSQLVEMKFKPVNQDGIASIQRRKQKFSTSKKNQYVEIYDPMSMVLHAQREIEGEQIRRLKFIASLSAEHFIIGNENQIDMIGFGSIAHGFVDTEYFWSLRLKGPIQNVTVDSKKSIILILSDSVVYFYRYNTRTKQSPTVFNQVSIKDSPRFIRFLKDALLGIFYSTHYEIYNVQNLNMVKKKLDKSYLIGQEKKLFTIPPSIDNIINLFFEQNKSNKQSSSLWCLEINFESEQIRTRQPYRVYDIMNYAKPMLNIQNHTKEIIIMNLKNQVMAIKNGYLIDTVNVSVNDETEILKYIHPQTILHVSKKNVGVYHFSIDQSFKPQKIVLKSIDSIEITNMPLNAFYITILQTARNNFAVFYEDSEKKKYQTKGEITYYFEASQTTTLKQKISSIFQSIGQSVNPQVMQEKYNMAKKMGLTEKEIYLEIWNRSNRSSLQDYQFILATRDYKTIKLEIEKKLKKESMVLREILRIEQGCFDINRQKIEISGSTEEDFQDYVTSHFLLKKLKLYREINVLQRLSIIALEESNESKFLKIDIQQYYLYKNLDINSFLIQQISDMLFNFKNNAKVIRIIIRHFKFAYRIVYKHILEEIITTSKDQLINLLNEIPQLLPYVHKDLNEEELKEGLYDGIWGKIAAEQWQQCLYPERIENIHNKQVLCEFTNSVWFKRFWLTGHDMVNKSKSDITEISRINNSENIFYHFIAKVYDSTKTNKALYYQIVGFLQQKYDLFPNHLRSKTHLYENLFIYYFNQERNNPARLKFAEFLQLDDEHLFKYYFDHQKVKKGSLLRDVKLIYQQADAKGMHLFNVGLFSYFYSDLSAISDLKFILNRINNEKTEFHQKNYGIYEVLVRSMQLKLKLGSPNDIPMDQILIYIQNIPLNKNSQIMEELSIMESINEQSGRFIQMKINMSVKEIMDQCDEVIGRIVHHEISKKKILKKVDFNDFREATFKLLCEVQAIKKKIYSHDESQLTLMVYLSIILEEAQMIPKVASLLEDGELHDLYTIQEINIENLVLYMFKWSFSKIAKYVDNKDYLLKLLDLLPHENQCRIFLQSQLELAILLSSPQSQIQYPLSETTACPTIQDVQQILHFLPSEKLLKIQPQTIFQLLHRMQRIVYTDTIKQEQMITLHKVYQVFITQYISKQLFKEVIPLISRILKIESTIKHIGIIYVIMFIFHLSGQFNGQSRKCILKLLAIKFYNPSELLKIIDFSIKTKLTGLQQTKYLNNILQKQSQRSNFNPTNSTMSKLFSNSHQNPATYEAIELYRSCLKQKRQDFQRIQYDIVFTIICQQPYLLAKFIDIQKQNLDSKSLQQFLFVVAYRQVFHPVRIFELLKRIFAILLISRRQKKEVYYLIEIFQGKFIEEEFQLPKNIRLNEKQQKILDTAQHFAKHRAINRKKLSSEQKDIIRQKRIANIKQILINPSIVLKESYELDHTVQEYIVKDPWGIERRKLTNSINFETLKERTNILSRTVSFKQFIVGKLFLNEEKTPELVRKISSPVKIRSCHSLSKDINYLQNRNTMIQHLYSHKVVAQENQLIAGDNLLDAFTPCDVKTSRQSIDLHASAGGTIFRANSIKSNEIDKQRQLFDLVNVIEGEKSNNNSIQAGNYTNQVTYAQPTQEVNEEVSYKKLMEDLQKTYNQTRIPRFEHSILETELEIYQGSITEDSGSLKQKQQFLTGFVKYLYYQPLETISLNLHLIEQIGRRHPQSGINIFFLQAYMRIYGTHEKYGLDLDVSSLLPISGLFIKSKDILDLFHEVEASILHKATDENIFKLSKLIALGFRKNVVEQEILFKYCHTLMEGYLTIADEEKEPAFEKIRSLWQKLQTQVMVEKGEQLFANLEPNERRNFMLQTFLQSLKNKGYASSAREIGKKILG